MANPNDADYVVRWPKEHLRATLADLINRAGIPSWDDRVELLLDDAFVGAVAREDFRTMVNVLGKPSGGTLVVLQKNLAELLKRLDQLPQESPPRKYWSERLAVMSREVVPPRGGESD